MPSEWPLDAGQKVLTLTPGLVILDSTEDFLFILMRRTHHLPGHRCPLMTVEEEVKAPAFTGLRNKNQDPGSTEQIKTSHCGI